MNPFAEMACAMQGLVALRRLSPTDRFNGSITREGLRLCIFKWSYQLDDFPDLWPDDVPEASSDGVPVAEQHRAILALLAERGPLKVDAIAQALDTDRGQLYRGAGDVKLLVVMGLAEKTAAGYRLTPKGERVAALLPTT